MRVVSVGRRVRSEDGVVRHTQALVVGPAAAPAVLDVHRQFRGGARPESRVRRLGTHALACSPPDAAPEHLHQPPQPPQAPSLRLRHRLGLLRGDVRRQSGARPRPTERRTGGRRRVLPGASPLLHAGAARLLSAAAFVITGGRHVRRSCVEEEAARHGITSPTFPLSFVTIL